MKGTASILRSEHASGRGNGFTLVEIIIVIVIIGILASIAFAKYMDMSAVAKAAQCKCNQMSLEVAQQLFYTEKALTGLPEYASDIKDLIPYLKNDILPVCPSNGQYFLKGEGAVSCTESSHQR